MATTTKVITSTGTTNWTCPPGVTSVQVELWGAGGTGGPATGTASGAGGGAGGQYAIKQVTVVPGTVYAVVVPAASTPATSAVVAGADATFASTTVVAKGGAGGANATGTTSLGGVGSTTGGVGDTVFAGGSGGAGVSSTVSGGGGSGAGTTGTGNSGSGQTAGVTKANNGGAGGTGVSVAATNNPGSQAGGGGSGGLSSSATDRAGGAGAQGRAVLTYTTPKTEQLRDDFNDNSTNTALWTSFHSGSSTIAESGSGVVATPAASTATVGYGGYDSLEFYDLTSSYWMLQIVTPVNTAVGAQQYMKLVLDGSNNVQWILENGTLKPQKTVATATSDITAGVAFNPVTHAWWRIRESAGTMFFDFSSDGVTWTNHTSLLNPITVTLLQMEFAAGTYQSVVSPGVGKFDNFDSTIPYLSQFDEPTTEFLRNRTPKRQQPPSTQMEPFYSVPIVVAAPSVAGWKQPVNQPVRGKRRHQPNSYKTVPPGLASTAPYVSYWKRPVEQFLRNRTRARQQPNSASYEPFYSNPAGPTIPSVSSWIHPVQQFLRNRIGRRQQPPSAKLPPLRISAAPYVPYWIQQVNQPLKSRVLKRQIPGKSRPPYPPLPSSGPYVSYWKQPVNQPLKNRVPKRLQVNKSRPPFPAAASAPPYASYWKQPVNQFLKSRVLKRLQVPRKWLAPAPKIYYVSTGGNDANDGLSTSSPWQTITKVNAHSFVPGDQIMFNGGQTFSGKIFVTAGGTASQPVVFGSYGVGNATISNTSDNAFFIQDCAGITIQNLNVVGGTTAMGNGSAGIAFFASIATIYQYILIDGVDASQFSYGVSIGTSTAGAGYNNITISNSQLHGNKIDGLISFGPTFVPASPAYALTNVTLSKVIAHDNLGDSANTTAATGNGIVMGSVNVMTIDQCTAYNNGISNAFTGAGPVGIWAYNSNAVIIKRCLAYNNKTGTVADGDGFDLDINTSNSTIEYCLAYGNYGAGILIFGAANTVNTGNTVRYNLCWGNGTNPLGTPYGEFALAGTYQNESVYNNTFVARDSATSNPYCVWFDGTANAGTVFRNNILYGASSPVTNTASAWAIANVLMQGNDYFRPSGTQIKWGATTYTTLAAWRAAITGQEVVSAVNTGFTSNPLIFGPATSPSVTDPTILYGAQNMILESVSPMVGTGIDLNATFGTVVGSQDYFGSAISAPFNVGATGFIPTVASWAQLVNQPLKSRKPKRQQPQRFLGGMLANASIVIPPLITTWLHPVNQFLRKRVLRRQQIDYTRNRAGYDPIPNPPPPVVPVFVPISIIIDSTDQLGKLADTTSANIPSSDTISAITDSSSRTSQAGEDSSLTIDDSSKNTTLQG